MVGHRRVAATVAAATTALALLGGLAGCGGNSPPHSSGTAVAATPTPTETATAQPAADGIQQVVIDTTDDDRFRPDAIVAHVGTIAITITNPSLLPHDFAIPALNVQSPTIFAGNSVTVTVTVTATGTYPFVCTFHQHQGMVGQLIVE